MTLFRNCKLDQHDCNKYAGECKRANLGLVLRDEDQRHPGVALEEVHIWLVLDSLLKIYFPTRSRGLGD